jgi:hypothetical protein
MVLARSAGLSVDLTRSGHGDRSRPGLEASAYRILQEALTRSPRSSRLRTPRAHQLRESARTPGGKLALTID